MAYLWSVWECVQVGYLYYVGQGFGSFFDSVSHILCEHVLPMVGAFLRQQTIAGSVTSPVSKAISSELVSLKGFTIVPSFTRSHRAFKCLMKCSVQQLMTLDAPNFRWGLRQRNSHVQTHQWPLVLQVWRARWPPYIPAIVRQYTSAA